MKVSKKFFALGCILFISLFSLDSIGSLWDITPEISNPQVTIAPDGNVLITWLEYDGQNINTKSKILHNDLASFFPMTVSSLTEDFGNHEHKIAVDLSGNVISVWQEQVDTLYSVIKSSILSIDADDWTPPLLLSNPTILTKAPELSFGLTGNGIASWIDENGIKTASLVKGNWVLPAIDFTPSNKGSNSKFAVDFLGNTIAVWEEHINDDVFIMGARLPFEQDQWIPSNAPLSSPNASGPQIATSNSDAFAIWVDDSKVVQTATLPSESNDWSSPPHNLSDKDLIGSHPQIVADFDGRITAIWKATKEQEGIEHSIIQSAVRLPSGKWLPAVNISKTNENLSDPQISADGFGSVAAAWRNIISDDSIVIQFAQLSSEGIWSDPIALSKEDERAGIPEIRVDTRGNTVVIWPNETLGIIEAVLPSSLDPRIAEMQNVLQAQADPLVVPVVTSISPNCGPPLGGTGVTITGTGFTGVTVVNFGAVPSPSFLFLTDSLIVATAPAGVSGTTVDVTVTNPSGTSATSPADEFYYAPQPTITGISPSVGPPTGGTPVTLTGTGFTGATAVKFSIYPATSFTVISDTEIIVISPQAVTCANIYINVVACGRQSTIINPNAQFVYSVGAGLPIVTSISPSGGPFTGGTVVTLTGTNLTGSVVVQFGSTGVLSTIISDTTITAVAPAGVACSTVAVTAGNCVGISASNPPSTLFTYNSVSPAPPPVVSLLSATVGPPAGGTPVTITGTGFTGATAVYFGSTSVPFTFVSDTSITTSSPAKPACTIDDVRVITCGGTSAIVLADKFTYNVGVSQPVVSGLSPSSGPPAGGTSVTISGTDFTNATAVKFGATNATSFIVNSPISITAVSPAGTASCTPVDVTVTTCVGTSAIGPADQFIFLPPVPAVTGVSPATGAATTPVTITGTNFTQASLVQFGGTTAPGFTVVNDTTITVNVPTIVVATNCQKFDVKVTTCAGISPINQPADQFSYQIVGVPAPTVTGVSPATGIATTPVTITGTNFTGASSVQFGTTNAPGFTVVNDTTITVNVPTIVGALNCEKFDVIVTTCIGTSPINPPADQFAYQTQSGPTVTGVTPATGSPTTLVTITGTNFNGASSVQFGTTNAPGFTIVNDTTITVNVPTIVGAVNCEIFDVRVTTCVGTSPLNPPADQFTYQTGTLAVTAVSPVTGIATTPVTITGTNFTGATLVQFGTTNAPGFTVVNDTTITVNVPTIVGATNCQKFDVRVTTCAGISPINQPADQFAYQTLSGPTVTGVSPASGMATTPVTITGTNFTGASAVQFGATNAPGFTVVNDTTITVNVPTIVGTTNCQNFDVRVTTCVGTSPVNPPADQFTYQTALTVTGVSPASGVVGNLITITGTSFTTASAVHFGATIAPFFNVVNDTTITVFVPTIPGATNCQKFDVTVTNCAGTSPINQPADQFELKTKPAPVITSYSGNSGPAGALLTINGVNFTGATSVQFGATNAPSFTVISDTQIQVNAPVIPGAINCQVFQVRVTTCVGTSVSFVPFTYFTEGIPTVTSLSQNTGTAGIPITITGSGFTGAFTVLFGGTIAPGFTVVNDTTITVNVPTIPVANCTPVNVRVQTCVGISQTVVNFTYQTGAPTISSILPPTGSAGTQVTIIGTNLAGAATANGVKFGTTSAPILSNTGTQITVNVPTIADATNCESFNVTVTTCAGTSSGVPFKYQTEAAPTVTGLIPATGIATTPVTITGTNFTGASSVQFGATNAPGFIVVNDTTITVNAPTIAGATNCEKFDVKVTTCVGTSPINQPADQFSYQLVGAPVPAVTGLSPATGIATTPVTITGTNFTGASSVQFGITNAPGFIVVNDTTITVNVPTILGATNCEKFDVTVTTCIGTSPLNPPADEFSYQTQSAPTVTGLIPATGIATTPVTITGTNFTGASSVQFGATNAPGFTVVNDTTITVNVPDIAGATNCEKFDVTVTTCVGTSPINQPDDQFSYQLVGALAPAVDSVSPNTGPVGEPVTIAGSGFTGADAVFFGTTSATPFTVVDDNTITTTAPIASDCTVDVTVVTCIGTSPLNPPADQFTYTGLPAPFITQLIPDFGPSIGLNSVTIDGTGFIGITSVQFGSQSAAFSVLNPSTILAIAPAAGFDVCQLNVTVTGCDGLVSNAVPYRYFYPPPEPLSLLAGPTITGLVPNNGPSAGGTAVNISGTNFIDVSAVRFDNSPATIVTATSESWLLVTSPPGVTCVEDVRILTCTQGDSPITPADEFTYNFSAPAVAGLSQNSGSPSGGNTITIFGTDFVGLTGAGAVKFGSINALSYTVTSPMSIDAVVPSGLDCVVDVTVTGCSGTSAPNPPFDQYTYNFGVPTITSVVPNIGPSAGGNSVVITGTNFASDASVLFGANPAISVTVNSTTQITVTAPAGALGTVDIRVTCCSLTSEITAADQYTYQDAPLPPSNFIGCIKKNKFLNGTKCVLQASWTASPSANAVAYRIYKNNTIIATIPAASPLVFQQTLPDCTATGYSITAVNPLNQESPHVPLVIVSG